jgi:hypothetical protein
MTIIPDFPGDFLKSIDRAVMSRSGSPKGDEITFRCPIEGHEDRHPSARWNTRKAIWRCDVCKDGGGALNLADRLGIDRPEAKGGARLSYPSSNTATLQHSGCTLIEYAEAKRIPVEFLKQLGVAEVLYLGKPAVRIPYFRQDGTEGTARYRIQMEKTSPDNRFRWKKGTKTFLYGLNRLADYRSGGEISIVEGESDTQTMWLHGVPAVGLPGAGNWDEQRDAQHFDGFSRINIVIEPDSGGEAVRKWLETSAIRDRVWLVDLGAYKDASGLHIASTTQLGGEA